METPAIDAIGLSHWFTDRQPVLNDISLRVHAGQFVSIVGSSGCGKTTFLNIVSGLIPLQIGSLLVNGQNPSPGAPGTAYVFARDALLPWRTVAQNVALPLELSTTISASERGQRVDDALHRVGLSGYANAFRSEISQGMRQRAALARTFVTRPRLLLMDEPFAALDAQTRVTMQAELVDLLSDWSATVLLVTHDLGEAITLSDRVVLFSNRPARVKGVYEIGLPRPRVALDLRGNPEFHHLYERIWNDLRDEVKTASG